MTEAKEEVAPETVPGEETEQAEAGPVLNLNESPEVFNQVFERLTRTGPGALRGGDIIRRRMLTFVVEGATCAPDVFVDANGEYFDFKLTIRQLNSREEAEAMAGVTDAGEVPPRLAKAALHSINGKPIGDDSRREFLWEALGMGGRQLVQLALNQIGAASASAVGKYQATVTVS